MTKEEILEFESGSGGLERSEVREREGILDNNLICAPISVYKMKTAQLYAREWNFVYRSPSVKVLFLKFSRDTVKGWVPPGKNLKAVRSSLTLPASCLLFRCDK